MKKEDLRKHTSDVITNVIHHYEDSMRDESTMRLIEAGVAKCIAPWAPYSYDEINIHAERIGGISKGAQVTVTYKADGCEPFEVKDSFSKFLNMGEPYDPTCRIEDWGTNPNYPQTQVGSKVETLPGGQGLDELADLEYFKKQLWKGLRLPEPKIIEEDYRRASITNDVTIPIKMATFEVPEVDLDTMTLNVMDEIQRRYAQETAEKFDKELLEEIFMHAPRVQGRMYSSSMHQNHDEAAEQLEFTLDDLEIDWDAVADILEEDSMVRSKPLFDEE